MVKWRGATPEPWFPKPWFEWHKDLFERRGATPEPWLPKPWFEWHKDNKITITYYLKQEIPISIEIIEPKFRIGSSLRLNTSLFFVSNDEIEYDVHVNFFHMSIFVLDDGYWEGSTIRLNCTRLMISLKCCIQLYAYDTSFLKQIELMRDPFSPEGIKVHPLIPCTYLDGRCMCKSKCRCKCKCKYLGTFVPDTGDWETRLYNSELYYDTLKKYMDFHCQPYKLSYDTSFLKRIQVVINGDVESNPGPIASAISHRIAIGRYYNKAVYLSSGLDKNIEMCFCQKYEQSIFKHSGYNYLTVIEMFDNYLLEKQNEYTAKDLEFCIATIELVYDVSFLKILQLVIDGDVESNPGPDTNNVETPRGKGRPKKVKKVFPKRKLDFTNVDTNIVDDIINEPSTSNYVDPVAHENNSVNDTTMAECSDMSDKSNTLENTHIDFSIHSTQDLLVTRSSPVGLLNERDNICFFNSVIQVLNSLPSFREHIHNTMLNNPVVNNMKLIFNRIAESVPDERIYTFQIATQLGYPNWNYARREQIDVLEFLSYILENSFEKNERGLTNHSIF